MPDYFSVADLYFFEELLQAVGPSKTIMWFQMQAAVGSSTLRTDIVSKCPIVDVDNPCQIDPSIGLHECQEIKSNEHVVRNNIYRRLSLHDSNAFRTTFVASTVRNLEHDFSPDRANQKWRGKQKNRNLSKSRRYSSEPDFRILIKDWDIQTLIERARKDGRLGLLFTDAAHSLLG